MNCYRCATPLPDNARFCMTCGSDVSGGSSGERTQPVEVDTELMAKLQEDIGTEYLIERELGRGGMAVVYLATDVHLGRKVAIKVLPPELTFSGGPHIVERFKREARTSATLDHPHIIPIHRVSTGSKLSWYVMKFLEGRTLADVIEHEAPLPPEGTADLIAQIAQGLEYAHRRGVIHRDIKPANIAIDAEGWVTVTDFGIAKALDNSSLTGSGSMIGTPYYMSPEQCAGQKVTGASDQYSLAVVAYQMLSGHLPFTGQAVVDIIKKHCMDPPPPLAVLQPNLPPALVAVVGRGLAKSAGERFGSVKEFAAAFSEAARHRVVEATLPVIRPARTERPSETAVVQPVVEPVRQTEPARIRGPLRPPSALRSRLSIALGAAGTLALAGIIFWPLIREARTRPDSPPAVDSRQASEPAASPAQTLAPLPDSLPPARESAAAPAQPTAERTGTVVLRDVPQGATISLDGRRVRGPRITAEPGRRHIVSVALSGFETWADTVLVRSGRTLTRTVQMRPIAEPAAAAAAVLAQPQGAVAQPGRTPTPVAQQPVARPPQAAQPQPQAAGPAAGAAYITVGSRPVAAMSINGRPAPSNPVTNFEVTPGAVRLRFTVSDSTGTWSHDTTVTVAAGERRNLGRITLVPPGPRAGQPQPQAAGPALGVAYITVGSRPAATITINGRQAPSNPVTNFEVTPGAVRLRFTVSDSTGTWSHDTTVTVAAGERRNLGRIALVRRL